MRRMRRGLQSKMVGHGDDRDDIINHVNSEALMKSNILVGLIHLNENQALLLGTPTARQYDVPAGSYVGVLEVFHQLHCLVSIHISTGLN
jgi:hypothetical protein